MFVGLPESEFGNLRSAIGAIARIYRGQVFSADMLITIKRNLTFRDDPRFVEAFNSSVTNEVERSIEWRLHVLTWAATQALHVDGDFVECGVLRGFCSAVVCKYLDFSRLARRFYLYDAFGAMPPETSTEAERAASTPRFADDPAEWLAFVQRLFAGYPNVSVIKGAVPAVFAETSPSKIAFLHIDMNAALAELLALQHLYDRVAPGGLIVFDDFGWKAYRNQTLAELEFMRQRGVKVLELPTGQGLVIKPPAPVKS